MFENPRSDFWRYILLMVKKCFNNLAKKKAFQIGDQEASNILMSDLLQLSWPWFWELCLTPDCCCWGHFMMIMTGLATVDCSTTYVCCSLPGQLFTAWSWTSWSAVNCLAVVSVLGSCLLQSHGQMSPTDSWEVVSQLNYSFPFPSPKCPQLSSRHCK